MRFLMLNWRDPRNPKAGGAERVSQGFLNALAARGHEVFWFTHAFPGSTPEERIGQINIIRHGGTVGSILAARRWVRSQPRFDLVIDQHHGIPWFAPWWCGTRSIAYIHEVLGPIWHSFYPWPISSFGAWQERITHRLYRHIPFWTVCESTRHCLETNGVREVKVLPNGLDSRPLPQLPDKPLGREVRFAVVSRLAPNKRIDHAIHTVARLVQRGYAAHLTIVGGGESEPNLRTEVDRLGLGSAIRFAGRLNEQEKDRCLTDAHFLLHTSVREGWGLNVLEANAMGTPAAVYPVAGLIDSTLDNQTGLVSAEETPDSLADRLEPVLKSPAGYQPLRQAAWKRAHEFTWDRVLSPACDWLESQAQR